MAAHRPALPTHITLLNPCAAGDASPTDDANSLACLLDALASAQDLAAVCGVLQCCLPHLVAHDWAALLMSVPDPDACTWQTQPPSAVQALPLDLWPAPLTELTHLMHGPALREAAEPLQALLRSLDARDGRYALLPLPLAQGTAVLCFGSALELPWTDAELRSLRRISGGLKLALQQALMRATMQRIDRDTKLLEAIRTTIAHTLDLDALLRQVVEQISLRYGYPLVSLYLLDGDMLQCKHQIGYFNVIRRVPVTTGIMSRAIRQRQTVLITDVRSHPEFIAAMPGVVSEIAVPLQSEQTVYGVLNIESTRDQRLGPSDQVVLEAVAAEVSIAIERAMLYTATHQQAQQLAVIDQLRAAIASQLDLDALGMTIVRLLRDQLRFEFVAILLLQDDMLCLRAWCGTYQRIRSRIKLDQGLNGLAIRKRQSLLIKNVQAEPEYMGVADGILSGMYVPLMYDQTVLGTLSIESRKVLTENDFEIVTSLREQIAAALEQSRRIEAAQRAREREAFLNKLLTAINQTPPDQWQDTWVQLSVQLGALLESDLCAIGICESDQTMTLNMWQAQRSANGSTSPQTIPLAAFDPQILEGFRQGQRQYITDLRVNAQRPSPLRRALITDGVISLAVVPVIVDNVLVALLTVGHNQIWPWEREDRALLEAVAQHLTVALRQTNLRMEEAQRRHELELVYQTALDINAHHDLESLLQAIVDRACALLNADSGTLHLLLPNGEEAELRVGVNIPSHLLGARSDRNSGLVGRTLAATHSVLVPDYSSWSDHDPNFDYTHFGATLAVPLIADRRAIGVLIVAHIGTNKQFSATAQRLIELLAAQAAQAIETAQLLEDVRRRSAEIEAVYQNALALSSNLNLQQVLQAIAERGQALIGCTTAGLNLLNPATQELELVVGVNIPANLLHTRIKIGEGVVGRSVEIRRTIRLDDYREWPDQAQVYKNLPWLSVMAVPLLSGDHVLGALGLTHTDPDKRFSAQDQQLMELFASQAAQAVEQAQRFERERILRSDAERSLDEMQAVLEELERTNERMGRIEKMRLLGELASEVAHDFNNALTSVLGNSQLLLLDETDPLRVETLSAIEAAARDSAAMIKRLQEFGRTQQEPYTEVVDVNGIVRDAVTMTQTLWREPMRANIRLEATLPVRGSVTELRRVLMNLIVNALDAMPDGGVLAIITEDVDDAVRISVSDTGVGMTPEITARVFDPFFTTKAAGMGTGLGLAICHQIVVRHGGTISVESQPGIGTTFTIYLPIGATQTLAVAGET
jgi:GAF domain-containing protein/anti-sigma regulatory factor (Ser/Thr protein kinase)